MEDYYKDCHENKWVDGDGIFTEEPHECIVCHHPTHRTDVNFEAALHAGACYDTLWEEYWTALTKPGPVDEQWKSLN